MKEGKAYHFTHNGIECIVTIIDGMAQVFANAEGYGLLDQFGIPISNDPASPNYFPDDESIIDLVIGNIENDNIIIEADEDF